MSLFVECRKNLELFNYCFKYKIKQKKKALNLKIHFELSRSRKPNISKILLGFNAC